MSLATDLVLCGSKLHNLWCCNCADALALQGDRVEFCVTEAYV